MPWVGRDSFNTYRLYIKLFGAARAPAALAARISEYVALCVCVSVCLCLRLCLCARLCIFVCGCLRFGLSSSLSPVLCLSLSSSVSLAFLSRLRARFLGVLM